MRSELKRNLKGLFTWAVNLCFCVEVYHLGNANVNARNVSLGPYSASSLNVPTKGLFTHTVSVPHVSVTINVYYCANGDRLFDGQNRFRTRFVCQTVLHYSHNGP